MDSDAENFEYLFEERDSTKHEKLVEKVLRLNKTQYLKKPSRTEPALHISEFNLVKSNSGEKGLVQINELTKSLKSRGRIKENAKRLQKNLHTLPKPLEKPQAKRICRSVGYERARLELDRWEATVTSNRVSTNLSFPINNDVKLDKNDSDNFANMWRVKSNLAEELEKHQPKVEEFHINLEQEKFPLTMKEMVARRKEAAKLRAYQGYKEAKSRRQNKIKSKKYHRIQKREKIKKKLKEFEQLQKTHPEEALKKLEEIEKTRIEERFSLRHKSTGKWARNQQIRAKYDKESRENLAQQLALSRELTEKSKVNETESDEEEEIEKAPVVVDKNNPWVNGENNETAIDNIFNKVENKLQKKMLDNVKKLKSVLNMKLPKDKKPKKKKKEKNDEIDLSLPLQKKLPQIDEPELTTDKESTELSDLKKILSSETKLKNSDNIDPEKYMKVKITNLSTAIPDILTTEENDEEANQRAIISEAFEDDDIINDFNKDKEDGINKDKPKDVNLSLPGWGSWGGANIKENKRKKRRFTIKAPQKIPRRDDNKGFLIINENAQVKIKEHLVSEVPFPFKTVKDFEASMRAPISNSFIPETAYRRLIKPSVTTKMGTIIDPISKDVLLNRNR